MSSRTAVKRQSSFLILQKCTTISAILKEEEVKAIFERVVKAAQGAALGTETTMEYEIMGELHDLLLNKTLGEVMQKNLEPIGWSNLYRR